MTRIDVLPSSLTIGTRGSPLALIQANQVAALLQQRYPEIRIAVEVISTTGDQILDRPLSEVGGKGLFTKELQHALMADRIDLAVHSMKDVATHLPDGLEITCILEREDPRDVFISTAASSLADLPAGSVVGTASLRRQAQILATYPDLKVVTFRGNVQSRLRKLAQGQADATMLALAGLNRLNMKDTATHILSVDQMLPAVAQGAVGIEIRTTDRSLANLLAPFHHTPTAIAINAERAMLAALDGSCRTPIAGHAIVTDQNIKLSGWMASPDGKQVFSGVATGSIDDPLSLGQKVAKSLRDKAGVDFMRLMQEWVPRASNKTAKP